MNPLSEVTKTQIIKHSPAHLLITIHKKHYQNFLLNFFIFTSVYWEYYIQNDKQDFGFLLFDGNKFGLPAEKLIIESCLSLTFNSKISL